ncbi:MAG: DUF4445 domain-containing protein [Thermoplasmata archaeon]|nr:DUF4445 domain-containing protein [Thermoplasmata archaeon]
MTDLVVVEFQPIGRRIEVKRGTSILKASQMAGVGLESLCGGEGWCEGCRVRLVEGELSPLTQSEIDIFSKAEIEAGFRLACQAIPQGNINIDIPPESLTTQQRLQIEGRQVGIDLNPLVKSVNVSMDPASSQDLRADSTRLAEALSRLGYESVVFDFPVLAVISDVLRENNWSIKAVIRQNEVIALLKRDEHFFGLAVDIGTTKLAIYLYDLETGNVVDKVGEMNPQIAYGEDVISRIAYSINEPNGRKILQRKLIDSINKKLMEICKKAGILSHQIVDAVLVGNTAMHHLLAGLPVHQLVYAPYIAAVSTALDIRARDIELEMAPGGYIHLLPNIAGYVGADHTAVILSTGLWKTRKKILAIDVGTNTEITLAANGRLLSCSCASGPAFEGAHIKDGMRAAPGAIERIKILNNEIHILTIDNQAPVGICGSGILDAVAEMKDFGIINEKGAMQDGQFNVRPNGKMLEFLLVPAASTGHGKDITVTRNDVNEIQLAKAAIRAGLETLMAEAGMVAEEIDEFIIAGAFGTYIDIPNAIKIGMFPKVPVERFTQVGNAAGMGAILTLLSFKQREITQEFIKRVEYVELTTHQDFQKEFIKAMYLA